MALVHDFVVHSPNVTYTEDLITSDYTYSYTKVKQTPSGTVVIPIERNYKFQVKRKVPKLGLMIVGIGGNNGSTLVAGVLANKLGITWKTKRGTQYPNYYGSITQASTVRLGQDEQGRDIYVPLGKLLPMVNPNDLVIGGWDINNANLAEAMQRAQVLDWDLQRQLIPYMKDIVPLPSIYIPDFIAANQSDRANNVIPETTKKEMVEHIRNDIRNFKKKHNLDSIVVVWSANTERYCEVRPGLNDTAQNLLRSIENNEPEISPSTLFAVSTILEGWPYINGSPQNTFVPGVVDLAELRGVSIGGDDFKSGQTKVKSVMVDFLISAGLKPMSIVSYNHLGNNDGKNLSAERQFKSKEISKSNVVDDMVSSNPILYQPGEHPDHCVVIKYIPYVGDSKRAMDEYVSKIFMNGENTIAMHNTCEDSLLAVPLIIDLAILAELMQRIKWKTDGMQHFESFHPVMSILSYLLKAPQTPPGTPVVNALFKQRACIENILKACLGLPPENYMGLEHKAIRVFKRPVDLSPFIKDGDRQNENHN